MKAVFLGSKRLGLQLLQALKEQCPHVQWHVLHPDDARDVRSEMQAFESYCAAAQLEFRIMRSKQETTEALRALDAEIGFVCGWYWLLDAATLALVPRGLWGVHNSLLPRYRGGAPLVWALIHGEEQVGSTAFKLSEGMDDGPVLHQVRVRVNPDDTIADALAAIEAKLMQELPAKWEALLKGEATLWEQDERLATAFGQRKDADGAVNWQQPVRVVHDFVRAQSVPYPCAFGMVQGQEVRLVRTRVLNEALEGEVGSIQPLPQGGVAVKCGDGGCLQLLQVTLAGEDMPMEHFAERFAGARFV